jgi:hypothetical protein
MILRQPYNASKSLTKASRCGQVRLSSIAAVARQRGGKPKRMKPEEGDMAAVEHGLSVSRLADLGQIGNPEIDLHNQPLELLGE